MLFQNWFMQKNSGVFTGVVHRVAFYLLTAASFLFLFAIGYRMTEQFMEKLDARAEKKLNSRVT